MNYVPFPSRYRNRSTIKAKRVRAQALQTLARSKGASGRKTR